MPAAEQVKWRVRAWWMIALACGLLIVQLVFPHRVWVILECGVGGMVLVAYVWARSVARSVRAKRALRYTWMQVGDLLEERFAVSNEGGWPVLWAEVDDRSTLPEYPARRVVAVGGHGEMRWVVKAYCHRRGLYTLGPWALRVREPFGIFEVSLEYPVERTLLILPPVVELPSVVLPRGVATGRAVARQAAAESTVNVSSVREYRPGDPLRHVHWPSTARHDRLMTRTYDAEISGDVWLVLDLDARVQAGEGEESTEEYGILLAASLADRLLRENRAVGLVAYGDRTIHIPPGRGEGQWWRMLRELALVHAGEAPSLAAILRSLGRGIHRQMAVVVITPSGEPEWVEALGEVIGRGASALALLLERSSFGGVGGVDVARAMLSGLGVPMHVIPRGYPFQFAKHRREEEGDWGFKITPTGRAVPVRRPREVVG